MTTPLLSIDPSWKTEESMSFVLRIIMDIGKKLYSLMSNVSFNFIKNCSQFD